MKELKRREFLVGVGVVTAAAALPLAFKPAPPAPLPPGGFLVTNEMDAEITKQIAAVDPIRDLQTTASYHLSGDNLDRLSAIYALQRKPGESDAALRARYVARMTAPPQRMTKPGTMPWE